MALRSPAIGRLVKHSSWLKHVYYGITVKLLKSICFTIRTSPIRYQGTSDHYMRLEGIWHELFTLKRPPQNQLFKWLPSAKYKELQNIGIQNSQKPTTLPAVLSEADYIQ